MDNLDQQNILIRPQFSEIDIHFARLMRRLSEQNSPYLYLAAAFAIKATGEGHVCFDLTGIAGRPCQSEAFDGGDSFMLPQVDQWRKMLLSSKVVGRPGEYTPLVLDDKFRLYLYRYWDYEKTIADELAGRAVQAFGEIDKAVLKNGLALLFPKEQDSENDWRQKMAAFVAATKSFCVISGGPGTGKSTVIAKILALILMLRRGQKTRIALAAPTGKAGVRIKQAINAAKKTLTINDDIKEAIISDASTIHRLLGPIPGSPYFRYNAENPLPLDVLIIDEASMVDLPLMSKLVQAVPTRARLLLLGDKDQLASVEPGAVLGDICGVDQTDCFSDELREAYHDISGDIVPLPKAAPDSSPVQNCVVQLKKNYRFGSNSGIGNVGRVIQRGAGNRVLKILMGGAYDDIGWNPLPAPNNLEVALKQNVIDGYKAFIKAEDPLETLNLFERFRIFCALRRGPYGVLAINRIVEQILHLEGVINKDKRWYPGRPILITRNDYSRGLFNGDIGMILPDPEADDLLKAFFLFPDGAIEKVLPSRLPEHETVYAMTVHKSQGSEFDRVLLILPDRPSPVVTRELIYTAITRAKRRVDVWGQANVFVEGVEQRTERTSGLHDALWWKGK